MYRKRMNSYYPEVIKAIKEFSLIIDSESTEVEVLANANQEVLDDAYLLTMNELRVNEWEQILGIKPLENSTLQDRRDTIVARIRGQGKLNTKLINAIVNAFTGGSARSWIEDSVLYVEVTPPPENKQYQFANVEQELKLKVPAHLGFKIERNYFTWSDIMTNHATWQEVMDDFGTWEDVYLFVPFKSKTMGVR